ncbi:MAG: hypothetical protein LQ338_002798 [Usnochroma carphineum]|nr:MAG: hypothetical protein LQ338_002798 [Usnochroma carphineum]
MKRIRDALSLFICLATVLAIPSPSQGAASISLALSVPHPAATGPLSVSGWIKPPTPPGFDAMLYQIPGVILNPVGVYLLAISYLHVRQLHEWAEPMDDITYIDPTLCPYTSKLIIRLRNARDRTSQRLSNGDVMIGLYDAVAIMVRDGFLPTKAEMTFYGKAAGSVTMTNSQTPGTVGSTNNSIQSVPQKDTISNSSSSSNADDSGTFVDPLDPTLAISYRFHGRRITSTDIYTSVMDSLIIMTYNRHSAPFEYLTAVSESGKCALHIDAIGGERPDLARLGRLVFLLALFLTDHNRFNEVGFALEVGPPDARRRVAEGYLLRIGNNKGSTSDDVSIAKA